jgi:hypothetical protein
LWKSYLDATQSQGVLSPFAWISKPTSLFPLVAQSTVAFNGYFQMYNYIWVLCENSLNFQRIMSFGFFKYFRIIFLFFSNFTSSLKKSQN